MFWGANRTVFLFQNDSDIARFPGTPRWYDEVDMPLGQFLARLDDPAAHGYLYFSTPVAHLGKALAGDVQPTSLLSPLPGGRPPAGAGLARA